MKILVTGSSGHLGEALVRVLTGLGHQVMGIDIIPSEYTGKTGSISDRRFVGQSMKGIDAVIHTATLHKPHVVTHSRQDFIDTNITGTLNLLEEAVSEGVKCFVFTSTTSAFGDALTPAPGSPAVRVTEDVVSIPRNIYGVTKTAAEDLCQLFNRNFRLPCLILRTARFFPEEDDQKAMRINYSDANIKANEFLYRRADIEDVVNAHILALEKAASIGFGKYIISATSPFTSEDLTELQTDAHAVVKRIFYDYEETYSRLGWKMFPNIGRVYVNEKARTDLGWNPEYDFRHVLDSLKTGNDFRSKLTLLIGSKGYHIRKFDDGPFPV